MKRIMDRALYPIPLLVGLAFFAGCVSMPKEEQTQGLLYPPSLENSIGAGLESGFVARGDWPEENWWEAFGSEHLNHLIAEALALNPTIQHIESRVEQAKQSAIVTRSLLFPLVFFDMDETWQYLSHNGLYKAFNPDLPLNVNLVDLTLSFNYEFDFWGRNRNLFHAALGREKAEAAEAAQVELITSTAVAQAYFALMTNLVRRNLYAQLVEVRRGVLRIQELLNEKALLSVLTPLKGEENLLEAQKWLYGIEEEVEVDKHLINVLVGRGPDVPLDVEEDLIPLPPQVALPDSLSVDLLARRPDLMAQIWRVEALAHDVGAAMADFYPDINLKGLLGLESVLYRKLLQGNSYTQGLQPAIHLPIFTAGAIRANIRAKRASFDAAVNEYNNLILQSAKEVADTLVFVEMVGAQMQDQEVIVADAEERYALTILRLEKGLDNIVTAFEKEEEWIYKELDKTTLLYNQYLAAIKLVKALGGGYLSEYVPLRKGEG